MAVIDLPELAIDNVANYGEDDDETRRQREAQRLALARLGEGALGDDESSSSRPAMPSYAESAARVAPHEVAPQDIAGARRTSGPSDANASRVLAQSTRERQAASPAVTANPQAARLAEQGLKLLRSSGDKSDPEAAMRRAQGERSSNRSRDAILNFASMFFGGSGRALDGGPDPVAALEERRRAAIQAEQERATAASRAADARSRDPNSPESQHVQQIARATIPGQPEEFYSSLTAADVTDNGPLARLLSGQQRGQQQLEIVDRRGERTLEQIGARGDEERETEGVRQEGRMDLASVNNAARMDLQRLRNEVRGRLRRSGGGGGGRGGAAAPTVEQLQEAYIDVMREAGTDLTDEQLRLRASTLSPRDLGAVVRTEGTATAGGATRNEMASRRSETQSQIAGWRRRADAPEITGVEQRQLRDSVATMEALRRPLRRLAQIHAQVDAAQRAGARADVLGPLMADARIAHEQAITALRNIGNYGVPQAAELARMESIAPRLESAAGFLSAGNVYPALERALSSQVEDRLASYGYERDTGGGGGQPGTVRMRARDGRVYPVRPDQVAAARAAGAVEVE